MSINKLNRRALRAKVVELVARDDFESILAELRNLPLSRTINALLGSILHTDDRIRWQAITAAGILISDLATHDLEAARVMIRRQFWNLTEESGAFAQGAPELIGEALANHAILAREFAHVLISQIMEEGNFLDFEPLLRGAVWGLGRLAQSYPELTQDAVPDLELLLEHKDCSVVGYTLWALKQIYPDTSVPVSERFKNLDGEIKIFDQQRLVSYKLSELSS